MLPSERERQADQLMTLHPERPASARIMAADADEPRHARRVTLPLAPRAAGLARQKSAIH
jgi:hypothetical protein